MNRRDMDLLDKQFAYLRPVPRGGLHLAMTVAIFAVGIGAGSLLVLRDPNAQHAALKDAPQTILASYTAR